MAVCNDDGADDEDSFDNKLLLGVRENCVIAGRKGERGGEEGREGGVMVGRLVELGLARSLGSPNLCLTLFEMKNVT